MNIMHPTKVQHGNEISTTQLQEEQKEDILFHSIEVPEFLKDFRDFREKLDAATGMSIGGAYLEKLCKDSDALEILRQEYGIYLPR